MATLKKGERQRRQKSVGKGGPKEKPARASLRKLSTSPNKSKGRLSQRELARLARERFERSQRSRLAAAKRKTFLQEQEKLASEKKAFLDKRKETRKKVAEIVSKQVELQEEIVKHLDKASYADEFRQGQRQLFDLKTDLKNLKHPSSVTKSQDQIDAKIAIKPSREFLQERIQRFYETSKSKLQRISPKHAPGRRWRVENKYRSGFVVDRVTGELLDETSFEEIVYQMLQDAVAVSRRVPEGRLFASFSFLEYGKGVPKSSHKVGDDDLGTFWQSFEGTSHLIGGATEIRVLEQSIRTALADAMTGAAGKNAVLLVGYEIKAFVEYSTKEQFQRLKIFRKKRSEREKK